ncbi:hypothetical protein EVAR_76677_1 [Eumeta japonica]|uniref:Uncharacterized protein n=1 Tax=Eumeta variegata TaxID=151549 RepID=A0A4C1YGR8_EUMVA|nr:hypothetical protein EVAR_76677_1 [Eumeta japonica]
MQYNQHVTHSTMGKRLIRIPQLPQQYLQMAMPCPLCGVTDRGHGAQKNGILRDSTTSASELLTFCSGHRRSPADRRHSVGESIRCWTCSSDNDPMCQDPFRAEQNQYSNHFILTNCDANVNPNYGFSNNPSRSVCKKQKTYVNGQLITVRSCSWKARDDYTTSCPNNRADNYAFCETCDYDACNSASVSSYFLALLAAPLGLLLFKRTNEYTSHQRAISAHAQLKRQSHQCIANLLGRNRIFVRGRGELFEGSMKMKSE